MRPVNADALQAVFVIETIMRRAWRRRQAEQPNRTTTTFDGAPVLRRINPQISAAGWGGIQRPSVATFRKVKWPQGRSALTHNGI